jgi:predicted PurR-regulated permease PerM
VAFITLLTLLAVVLALVVEVFWRFLVDIGLATAMALMLHPVHERVTRALRGHRSLSALLITLGVNAAILIPVVALLLVAAREGRACYAWLTAQLSSQGLETFWSVTLPGHFGWLSGMQQTDGRAAQFLTELLSRLASAVNGLLQSAVVNLSSAMFDIALLLLMLFFFLRDGSQFHAVLRRISPLSRDQFDSVTESLSSTMQGALAALLVAPLVQGVLATLLYWALGVPNALLWGALTTLVAFIPAAGTALVWVPICIYLWVQGELWQSLTLAAFGALVVSSVDNVLRPILLKGSARIHPLWSLLAILGGVFSFGALGLLVGPLVLSLGLSALRIYELEVLRGQRLAAAECDRRAGA